MYMKKRNMKREHEIANARKLKFLQTEVLALKGTTIEELVQQDIETMLNQSGQEVKVLANNEKKTVVALVVDKTANRIQRRGIAKCYYLDQYNEVVGQGVAIRKALGFKKRDWENFL